MNKLKVAIIGCGSIGALKPVEFDRPGGDAVLTHAHAFHDNPDCKLVAVCDTYEESLLEAASKWTKDFTCECDKNGDIIPGTESLPTGYFEIDKMMTDHKPDIVVVATPDETHYDVVTDILLTPTTHMPKLIIAEKPLTESRSIAERFSSLCKRAKVPLLVNYTRRFVPEFQRIREQLQSGEFGQIYSARFTYGRGLVRDGCHAVDLARWWFGDYLKPDEDTANNAYNFQDSIGICPSFTLTGGVFDHPFPIDFRWGDSRAYSVFDWEVWTEKAVLEFRENGARLYYRAFNDEGTYGSYPAIKAHPGRMVPIDLTQALPNLAAHAVDIVRNGVEPICTGEDAVAVWNIMEELL